MADPASKYIVQPLRKALDVLKCIGQHAEPMSLKEISVRLGLPKTTVLRYLRTFEASHFVAHDRERDVYRIDTRIISLINLGTALQQLREACLPHLRSLQERCTETVNLGVLEGSDIVYLEIVASTQLVRTQARVGGRHPVHTTALGKAILAFLPPEARAAALPRVLRRRTEKSTVERVDLVAELDRISAQGFSEDNNENENGAICLGAPVFDSTGTVVGAFSISAPSFRTSADRKAVWIPQLLACTRAASRDLGYLSVRKGRIQG
jgi:IclR family KDG regulon transcriptional repressor